MNGKDPTSEKMCENVVSTSLRQKDMCRYRPMLHYCGSVSGGWGIQVDWHPHRVSIHFRVYKRQTLNSFGFHIHDVYIRGQPEFKWSKVLLYYDREEQASLTIDPRGRGQKARPSDPHT